MASTKTKKNKKTSVLAGKYLPIGKLKNCEHHMTKAYRLQNDGNILGAIELYELVLKIEPNNFSALQLVGLAYCQTKQYLKAVQHLDKAIKLNPKFSPCYNNMGIIFLDLGYINEAISEFDKAIAISPDYPDPYSNRGNAYRGLLKNIAAIENYNIALSLQPDYAKALSNRGSAFVSIGQLEKGIQDYRQAIKLESHFIDAYSSLLFALNYHPDKTAEEIFLDYKIYNEVFVVPKQEFLLPHTNTKDVSRKLKVGYVSPDFKVHPLSRFLEPVLDNHNHAVFEIYAYALHSRFDDDTSLRYKSYVDHWVPCSVFSAKELAEQIRLDKIDILIDLAGHTAKNSLDVFALKPAPISVSWLGYGYTTGSTAIDYFLTDETSVPFGADALFSEKPWRLKTPGMVFRPAQGMGEVSPLPAKIQGFVTFGTLTRAVRINYRTIQTWAAILKQVDNSRLVINSMDFQDVNSHAWLIDEFEGHGITSERLKIGFQSPPWDLFRNIDIGLDCFPHNSGTTLFETLYMGLPFITLASRPSVGRIGSAILKGLGYPEWIADTEGEYVKKVVDLARDLPALAEIRAGLRSKMAASPLMDEQGFTKKVETAYRQMFTKWCESTP